MVVNNILEELLSGDYQEYGYLFPSHDRIPKIGKHIFTDLKQSEDPLDEVVLGKMLDIDYIGWTAKILLNIDLFPIQIAMLQMLWHTPFPMIIAARGGSKTFLLAVYAILRALLDQGSKIVIVGAGLRQAKLVFNYIETIWNNSPMLRSVVDGGKNAGPRQNVDLCYFKVGNSIVYALPMGDGQKIRGFRATVIIADEMAAIPQDVFDIVVRGFASTTKTPVEEAKRIAFDKQLMKIDIPADIKQQITADAKKRSGNQIIHCGTAYYGFNHFAKLYNMWQSIIRSKGDSSIIADIFGGENLVPENFDYKDYTIMRIPYTHLPEGLLEQKQIAHAKATLPRNIFLMEYGATFVTDSDGFYSRSLIESCTVGPGKPISTPDGDITFTPLMRGNPKCKYVIGIDPAAEQDKFAIVVIEVWPNHYRIVYCWVVNKPEFIKRKKQGLVTDDDYYAYCCSKIRDVVRLFNPVRIEMDSQGGGYAVEEMLRNKKLLDIKGGDFPIYQVIDSDNPQPTDGETDGRRILHLVQPSTEYNQDANVVLHKSLETRTLLFPAFDTVKMYAAIQAEKAVGVSFDTYEQNVFDLEELKNELCTIQMTETATGKEKFDTPQVVSPGAVEGRQRKGRLKKDRYIALLMAHKYVWDTDTFVDGNIDYNDTAGNIAKREKPGKNEDFYCGPGLGRMQNAKGVRQGGVFKALKRGKRI